MYVGIVEPKISPKDIESINEKSRQKFAKSLMENRQSIRLSKSDDTEEENTMNLLNFFKQKDEKKKQKHGSEVFQLPFKMEEMDNRLFLSGDLKCLEEDIQDEK